MRVGNAKEVMKAIKKAAPLQFLGASRRTEGCAATHHGECKSKSTMMLRNLRLQAANTATSFKKVELAAGSAIRSSIRAVVVCGYKLTAATTSTASYNALSMNVTKTELVRKSNVGEWKRMF